MALKDLFFSIFAKDETGAGFNSVKDRMRGVEGAAVNMTTRIDRAGKSLIRLAGMGSVVSAGLATAFRGSSGAYEAQVKAEGRVERAIRATGGAAGFTADQLSRTAKELQGVSGFGDQDILGDVTAQLLGFNNIVGDVFRDANRLAVDLAAGMGSDLRSAAALMGQALNDPVKGLDSLSEAGLRFSGSQRAQIEAMQAAGNVAGAQRIILDELGAAYAGQAEVARSTADGAKRAWRAMMTDVREVAGGVLNDVLPPVFDGLSRLARMFLDLSPPVQKAVVVLGGVAVVIPPLTLAVSGLAVAVNALMGPVGIATLGLTALAGAVAVLWPQKDRATDATFDMVTALGDEITQSQLLHSALNNGIVMSVNTASQKLAEARSRYENVKAIIAERRVLAQSTAAFVALEEQLTHNGIALAKAEAMPEGQGRNAQMMRHYEERRGLIMQREHMTATSKELTDQLDLERQNIEKLEAGMEGAKGAMIQFGDAVVTPIEPSGRLERALGGSGGAGGSGAIAGGGVRGALAGVTDAAETAVDALDELHETPVWDSVKRNLRGLLDGSQGFGDTFRGILGDALDRIFDLAFSPAWDRLFSNLQASAGFSGPSGGMDFGGLLGGITGAFRNLVGFDTGGAFTVRGRGGSDRNVAAVRLSEGERVEVLRRGEGSGGGRPVIVNIHTPDPAAFAASRAQIARQIGAAVALADRAA